LQWPCETGALFFRPPRYGAGSPLISFWLVASGRIPAAERSAESAPSDQSVFRLYDAGLAEEVAARRGPYRHDPTSIDTTLIDY